MNKRIKKKVKISHPGSLKKYGFKLVGSDQSQEKAIRKLTGDTGKAKQTGSLPHWKLSTSIIQQSANACRTL
jgi:hypothetical protein